MASNSNCNRDKEASPIRIGGWVLNIAAMYMIWFGALPSASSPCSGRFHRHRHEVILQVTTIKAVLTGSLSIDLHNRGVSTSIWFSKACQLTRTANSLAGRGDDPNGYSLGIVWQNPPELRVLPRLAYCSRMPITLFFGIVGGERPNTAL